MTEENTRPKTADSKDYTPKLAWSYANAIFWGTFFGWFFGGRVGATIGAGASIFFTWFVNPKEGPNENRR